MTAALFELGRTVATPGALRTMSQNGINAARLLERHASGDFGDLTADLQANMDALSGADPARVFSVYRFPSVTLWCITEWDRSVTTLLLPEEY
jgi:hypothetical protein